MSKQPNIIDFTTRVLGLSLSLTQRTLLKSMYGLAFNFEERAIYSACTGRGDSYPANAFPETTVIAGARSGKDSRIAVPTVLYEVACGGHEKHLARGEQGVICCIAQDTYGAGILGGYLRGHFGENPLLKELLIDEPLEREIRLKNRMKIVLFPSTQTATRGWSIPLAVMDELGFWRLEGSSNSDIEIQQSIRRGQIAFPGKKLLKISTPFIKGGVLFDDFKNFYGQPQQDVLVWRASSSLMNPSLDNGNLEREQRLDPQRFEREYMAEFIDDISAWIPGAWVESAVTKGIEKRAPRTAVAVRLDRRSIGPAHRRVHALRLSPGEKHLRPGFLRAWHATGRAADLDSVVKSICEVSAAYGCKTVIGDQASESWSVRVRRARHGFSGQQKNTSECYLASEVFFATGRVELLDDAIQTRASSGSWRRPRPWRAVNRQPPQRRAPRTTGLRRFAGASRTRTSPATCRYGLAASASPPWAIGPTRAEIASTTTWLLRARKR